MHINNKQTATPVERCQLILYKHYNISHRQRIIGKFYFQMLNSFLVHTQNKYSNRVKFHEKDNKVLYELSINSRELIKQNFCTL